MAGAEGVAKTFSPDFSYPMDTLTDAGWIRTHKPILQHRPGSEAWKDRELISVTVARSVCGMFHIICDTDRCCGDDDDDDDYDYDLRSISSAEA